ncbi:hypothetical protein Tco_0571876, partial [Tanacetum coccineum]
MPYESHVHPPLIWPSSKTWSWQELEVVVVAAEVPAWVPKQPSHPHQQQEHPQ